MKNYIYQKIINGSTVRLSFDGTYYNVKVDGNLYYRSCNQLFAVQRFNEI